MPQVFSTNDIGLFHTCHRSLLHTKQVSLKYATVFFYTLPLCLRVALSRISSQFLVSDLGEWRHSDFFWRHFFFWKKTRPSPKKVTNVTSLTRHSPTQVSDVTFVPFFGDKKCDASHLSHFWEECDALAHENMFFNWWHFLSHPSQKTSHFGPASTKKIWTGRNVTIRLGLKHF